MRTAIQRDHSIRRPLETILHENGDRVPALDEPAERPGSLHERNDDANTTIGRTTLRAVGAGALRDDLAGLLFRVFVTTEEGCELAAFAPDIRERNFSIRRIDHQ